MNRWARILLLFVIALLSIGLASATVFLDEFERANNATVGGNWTESETAGGYFAINTSTLHLFAPSTSHTTDNIYTDLSNPSNITISFINFTVNPSHGIELYLKDSSGNDLMDMQLNNGVIQVRTSDTISSFVTIGTYVNGDNFNLTFADLQSDGGDSLQYDVWVNNTKVDNDRVGYWDNGATIGRIQFSMINPWSADLRINNVCVDSDETYCVTATPPVGSSLDNFTVNAQDAYSSASITGFNVTFDDLGITTEQTSYNHTTEYMNAYAFTNNGAIYNTTTWAYDFDGINDNLQVTDNPSFTWGDEITLNVWFKTNTKTQNTLIAKASTSSNREFNLNTETDGRLRFWLSTTGTGIGSLAYSPSNNYTDGKIHLASVVYNSSHITLYVDGEAGTPVTQTGNIHDGAAPIYFGRVENTWYLNGSLYGASIYQTGLNSSEISNVYNKISTNTNPILYYNFINFSTEPSTFDYSGQGNTLTNNGATYNSANEYYDFSSGDYLETNALNLTGGFNLSFLYNTNTISSSNRPVSNVGTTDEQGNFFLIIQSNEISAFIHNGSEIRRYDSSGLSLATGTPMELGVRYNPSVPNVIFSYNGTTHTQTSSSNAGTSMTKGNALFIGKYSTSYADGIIYNFSINSSHDKALYTFQNSTVGDVTVNGIPNYFGNTTQKVNTSAVHTSKHTRFPEALFYDAYTGLNITSFNVTINATVYTTTNGTLYIPYKDLIGTSSATKYFSASNTISNRTEYLAHYASITGFNAYDKVSGQNVSTFQANTTSEGGSATNNSYLPQLYTTYGNFTAEYNKASYYQAYTTYEAQPQTSQEANFTVYNHKANFTITIGIGGSTANNFTIDIYDRNNYSFHEQQNTTTGSITFNLSHGNYTAIINDTIHTLTRYNFTLEETNNRSNFTITTYTTNTVNITFIDEETNRIITQGDQNATVTAYITGSQASYNFTDIINGSLLAEMINPQSYTITYSATGYGQREKHFTLTNRTYEYLTLYLLNESTEDLILFTVRDAIGTNIENATVRAQRKNLSGTNYYEVDNCVTGTEGTCTMRLILYDPTYRFVVDYNDATVKTTGDQKITSTSVVITVDLTTDELAQIKSNLDVTGNVTYNNNTETFTFTWNNPAGTNVQGCMEVTARKAGIYTTLNNTNCGTSSSGSVTYTINESIYDEFTAKGYVTSDGIRRLVDTYGLITGGFGTGAGANGLFIFGFFILGTLAMAMLWNPIAAPIVLVGGLALFSFAGIISIPLASIGGLIALVIGFIALSNR